jgi:PAS domain S-box-containing protein
MITKILFTLALPLLLLGASVHNTNELNLTQEETKWLSEHPEIRFTGDPAYLPYEAFDQKGNYVGMVADYVNIIEKKLGIKFKKIPSKNWSDALQKAKKGDVDVISDYTVDQALDSTHLSTAYHTKSTIMIVSQKEKYKSFLIDLFELRKGDTIAVVKGYGYVKEIYADHPDLNYVEVENIQTAMKGVATGKYNVALASAILTNYILNQPGYENLQIAGQTDATMNLAFRVKKEWKPFVHILDKTIHSLTDEERKQIATKWMPKHRAEPIDHMYLLQILGVVVLGLIALFYWNYQLKRLVKQKTDRINTLLESFDDHVIASSTDLDGSIIYVSDAFCRISGYDRDDLMGNNHRVIKHPDNPDELYKEMWNTITNGQIWRGKVKNTKKDGEYYCVESIIEPEYDAAGKHIGYTSISHDVKAEYELKELSSNLEKVIAKRTQELALLNEEQHAIFDSTSVGIALIQEHIITQCNRRIDEMFSYEPGEQIGLHTTKWFPEDFDTTATYMRMREGQIATYEQQVQRKDGSVFWAHLAGRLIDIHSPNKGVVLVIEDISVQRQAIEDIQKAKQLAEDATKSKSNFLANMSHEIRTPMNAIIGMSHLALETNLDDQQRNYIQKVENAAKNLLGIINDILDFSKIEAGKLILEQTNFYLEDILDNISDIFVLKTQEKGIELLFNIDTDFPTALIGDPLRLGQVLTNLVSNAVKFTEHGEIVISAKVISSAEGAVELRFDVSDTGIGLSPEQRDKLFSAFSQADTSTTRKYGGTGLGLSICKHIVTMMNGSIDIESELGHGSNFHFTITLGLQEAQRKFAANIENLDKLRVLVVDDNAMAREILEKMITSLHFDVKTVKSGEEAINELENAINDTNPYGLVIMDWMMPEMDGVETIIQIRNKDTISSVPAFVMVTAYNKDELMVRLNDITVEGILTKPVNPSNLYETILGAFGTKTTRHPAARIKSNDYKKIAKVLSGGYLLLVEDNLMNQEIAVEILEKVGIRVDVANNGAEALEKIEQTQYDGVLMDCQMPVMDGYEATSIIRQNPLYDTLPIIAMTANTMEGDREKCLIHGMNDHIAKPLDVIKFFETLSKWIKPKNPIQTIKENEDQPSIGLESILIPNLNINVALDRMAGDERLLLKLLKRFAQTQLDFTSRLHKALDNGNIDEATREVHSLKGLCGNIGAVNLFTQLQTLEKQLMHREEKPTDTLIQTIDAEIVILIGDIVQSIMPFEPKNNNNEIQSETIDVESLTSEMETLKKMLSELDSDANETSEPLIAKLEKLGFKDEAKSLATAIQNFDFETAGGYLSSIAANLHR